MSISVGGSLGAVHEKIRGILGRLGPVEATSAEHRAEIQALRANAEKIQNELEKLHKITSHQGQELAEHNKKIAELNEEMSELHSDAQEQEGKIARLSSTVRGEQIKRGKAAARAERAEEKLKQIRK